MITNHEFYIEGTINERGEPSSYPIAISYLTNYKVLNTYVERQANGDGNVLIVFKHEVRRTK